MDFSTRTSDLRGLGSQKITDFVTVKSTKNIMTHTSYIRVSMEKAGRQNSVYSEYRFSVKTLMLLLSMRMMNGMKLTK